MKKSMFLSALISAGLAFTPLMPAAFADDMEKGHDVEGQYVQGFDGEGFNGQRKHVKRADEERQYVEGQYFERRDEEVKVG